MSSLRPLPSLVRKQFKVAQETGDLTSRFIPLESLFYILKEYQFIQVRFSLALANKPKSSNPRSSKPIDPFENPPKDLFVAHISEAHYVVLNKFLVIPDHFILATTKFKEHTHMLEQDNICAAYACLKAYRDNGEKLFGFFNSGEHSGASQPHRHIQFLPVKSMQNGVPDDIEWDILVDILAGETPNLPFTYFSSRLVKNPSPERLHSTYIASYEQAYRASGAKLGDSASSISYNLGFTDRSMVIFPRKSEGTKIAGVNGALLGPISLNGILLGGTRLVKSEDEWNALSQDASKLSEVLLAIGIPKPRERL